MRLNLVGLRKKIQPTQQEIEARKENAKNRKGLSQEEMAKRLEISRAYCSNMENGKADPTFEIMIKFEELFKDQYEDIWELFKKSE